MQTNLEETLSPDRSMCSEIKITQDFYTHLKISNDKEDDVVKQEQEAAKFVVLVDNHHGGGEEEEGEEEEEEEEEFSFMCGGANTSPIAAEDAFVNGQIKPVFPLFNRDLLFAGQELNEKLPMRPPVKKVFVETSGENGQVTSSSSENDGVAGPHDDWSNRKAVDASPEVCKKSNSTGFSKIWRFKDLLGRSNSDGRDAFVFLNNGQTPPSAAEQPVKGGGKGEKKESTVKLKGKGRKGGKSKAAPLSAHEVYLRSKAKEEERRRSYLPYRPELMGFFTNVSGGLSKNVHPF